MNGRERIQAMIEGRPVDRLPLMPITMMYAADQIGAQYGKYAADHRVLADAQLKTAEKFDLDFVSTISDPAREAADCGATVHYFPDQPPGFDEQNSLLADKKKLVWLKAPDPLGGGRMFDRVQGVELLKKRTGQDRVVEGWVEGPCAQGADLRGINTLMTDFGDDPIFVNDLMEFVVDMELKFARVQVEAGADIIGMGDAAASLVGPRIYEKVVWPFEKRMVDGLHAMGVKVRLHICGNTRRLLGAMGRLGCDIVDLDLASLAEGRAQMGEKQILLGNIHPVHVLKNGTEAGVTEAIGVCHREAGEKFIVGAGCEVPRGTPAENMMAMTRYARDHTPGGYAGGK